MEESVLEKLRYPIGRFINPAYESISEASDDLEQLKQFPDQLSAMVSNLSDSDLEKTYRPEGWTIRQVIHHCADSHMNAFIRFKLALTEDQPMIKPYLEDRWAELADSVNYPIEISLNLLTALHQRWYDLLLSLSDADLKRSYHHPEHGTLVSLSEAIATYAWHCRHHLAHVQVAISGC